MSINPLDWLRGRAGGELTAMLPPWDREASSVHARVLAAAQAAGDAELDISIHDDDLDGGEGDVLRWAAGAREALFGRPEGSVRQISARQLLAAMGALLRRPSDAGFAHLYALAGGGALGVVDDVLERLPTSGLERTAIAALARRLAAEAPDVEPVKLGMALLGATGEPDDRALLLRLSRYEELTLYAIVGLQNLQEDAEADLWTVARTTHGWGRIQAIRALRGAREPAIRDWLLREGFRNTVMYEETAWLCATEGGLLEALRQPHPDEALLEGAGELIVALLADGPAEDIDNYADGGEVCHLLLKHLAARPVHSLPRFSRISILRDWLAEPDADWAARKPLGWTAERRWNLRQAATAWLERPEWRALAMAGLDAEDSITFWDAARTAAALGVDVWPHKLSRQRDGVDDHWWELMQTDDPVRVDQVLDLAREKLDLALVGSGPTRSLGLGPDYASDNACDFIVQDLRRFPGVGPDFIEVALRGRSVRLRNMALQALEAWGREHWPAGAMAWLRAAAQREPDPEVAESINAVLSGRPFA